MAVKGFNSRDARRSFVAGTDSLSFSLLSPSFFFHIVQLAARGRAAGQGARQYLLPQLAHMLLQARQVQDYVFYRREHRQTPRKFSLSLSFLVLFLVLVPVMLFSCHFFGFFPVLPGSPPLPFVESWPTFPLSRGLRFVLL